MKQLTRLSGFSVFVKVMFGGPVSSSWASWAPPTRGTRVDPEDVESPLQCSRLECLCLMGRMPSRGTLGGGRGVGRGLRKWWESGSGLRPANPRALGGENVVIPARARVCVGVGGSALTVCVAHWRV